MRIGLMGTARWRDRLVGVQNSGGLLVKVFRLLGGQEAGSNIFNRAVFDFLCSTLKDEQTRGVDSPSQRTGSVTNLFSGR